MKVYVLTTHEIWDWDDWGIENRIFSKKDDAMKALDEWKTNVLPSVTDNEWEIAIEISDYFEAYEDGRYCQNHVLGRIREEKVE